MNTTPSLQATAVLAAAVTVIIGVIAFSTAPATKAASKPSTIQTATSPATPLAATTPEKIENIPTVVIVGKRLSAAEKARLIAQEAQQENEKLASRKAGQKS